jgi:superoxide dismutase, Fe-Mn family
LPAAERAAWSSSIVPAQNYTAKKWSLSGLQGISDRTLEMHFGLYEGYVKNTNLLNEQLGEALEKGQASGGNPHFAELKRRLGFEYNGMRLHELYFDNLSKERQDIFRAEQFSRDITSAFGDVASWRTDFTAVGQLRGVGWAILFRDLWTGALSNNWVTLHEDGNLVSCAPILVMDVWEHAFLLDHKPSERGVYIESFLAHVDWDVVELRNTKATAKLAEVQVAT